MQSFIAFQRCFDFFFNFPIKTCKYRKNCLHELNSICMANT